MPPIHQNPYQQYRQNQTHNVNSASRVELIAMLLEGAVNYNKKVLIGIEDKNMKVALEHIDNATKIITHLYSCLDLDNGGEVAENLGKLYAYCIEEYIGAQKLILKKQYDPSKILAINRVVETILDGWRQLPKV